MQHEPAPKQQQQHSCSAGRTDSYSTTNIAGVCNSEKCCTSLQQLTQLTVQQLEELMGNSRGVRMLPAMHDFLHAPCPVAQTIGPM